MIESDKITDDMVSICKSCYCMTLTLNGRCGKCGEIK